MIVLAVLSLKNIGENVANTSLQVDQIEEIGTIRVTVFRAKAIKLAVPYFFDANIPKTLDEIPERMLKGKAIKNNVK